ncbi:MAG: NAD(P)-dependent oxidoreductase [Candidatus Amulumruptor caecigallinarius]|nr:NAD(P)-dependent oxidoreductase [Candidatus Amulumruptor caecigallinarius]MCM1396459.1 NAD(P)-dependent oxidoreductase [Candidatus Amulumruptor caecigallinarius]MCM1453484.1 NAD(P)-dependent oxidoreductase [bacterium]
MPKRVLIIGAGGFIGGFIADEARRRGYDTWCAVRATTSRRYLTDPELHFVELDYDSPEQLRSTLSTTLPEGEKWDYVVHNLGATKCTNFADFNRINFGYLREVVNALRDTAMVPEGFLYMSSLSALGPGDEKDYTPYPERAIPSPNTRYGLSKIKAETFLQTLPDFPWIVLRPTGVYGPHEKDYMMMVHCIDRHVDFGVGFRKQLLTFIYVEDLARAVFDALEHIPATLHHAYAISEPRAYTQTEFRRLVARLLGRKFVIPVRLPLWATYITSAVAEKVGVLRMKPSTLNRDKYLIMKQRNWSCDTEAARRDFGFVAQVPLEEGLRRAIESEADNGKV